MKKVINLIPEYYTTTEIEGVRILIHHKSDKDNEFNLKLLENRYESDRFNNYNNIIYNKDYILVRDNNIIFNNTIDVDNITISRDKILKDFVLKNIDFNFESVNINEDSGIYTFKIFKDEITDKEIKDLLLDLKNILCSNNVIVNIDYDYNSEEIIITFDTNKILLKKAINKLEHILYIIRDICLPILYTSNMINDYYKDLNIIADRLDIDVSKIIKIDNDSRKELYVKCGEYYYRTTLTMYGFPYITTNKTFKI